MTKTSTNTDTCSIPLRAVVVGAGNRSKTYASYALTHPDELQIVGVIDPEEIRRHRLASGGGWLFFRDDKAPEGAGTRCLTHCLIEAECLYSARRQYVELNRWGVYVWRSIEHLRPEPSVEQKLD
ncbi:hypothetical protein FE784_18485 [Paenibacillus hemerocallicola]|jgi:hypothetical protein|uniref:Gfo/Idh/MocA-like oxidoreductase N-terminal domain-containing protein n=1 Tax=Paenibacillus hemerocallicola TaxID=1172614 RepID=A0A5C4T6Y6_9BACL|nr:hypothetical protein [Paenibacillus hemerocallicola]TNJ64833.1 hypothetical protein FE784_18485 [Paenibacillus hemerocallicola]